MRVRHVTKACYTQTRAHFSLARALEAACRIAQPAAALTTMPPQLWVPLSLMLLYASLVATPIGAEAAGAAMMPNNGDRFGNVKLDHVHWRTLRTSVPKLWSLL